ncbi:MAG: hypothetical protein GWM87_03580 [Xanthomonadales bacterium]|nr:hypothetical protein [Xanthomonadales bacterium]NIX12118.1 hypothetical protein [Xanthomonadales bacterium]
MNSLFENLERKAFRSFWDDGLVDLLFGVSVATIGLSWWLDLVPLGAVFPALAVSLWVPLRRRLVDPRLGYVEFSGERELKTRSFRHGMTMFMAGTALLGAFVFLWWESGTALEFRRLVPAMPALLIGLLAIPFAVFTGCRRFYGYTLVMVVAGIVTLLLDSRPGPFMLAGGIAITISGAAIMGRFLATYPSDPDASP